jgi:hypothetical protein
MNFSFPPKRPRFDWGCKGTLYFLICKFFCEKFENFIFSVSLGKNSWPLSATRFSNGSAKVRFIFKLANFSASFLTQKSASYR